MKHHSLIARLGAQDGAAVMPLRRDSHVTQISFIEGKSRLEFGLGQTLQQLGTLGLATSERAIDLLVLAALVTAADTRVSREQDAQDRWTREMDLFVPVSDPELWARQADLLSTMLNFLTGDRWRITFRSRMPAFNTLAPAARKLRTANPTCVCLLSGGLDSFIGAADLLSGQDVPLFVSHYWDGITSKHQTFCTDLLTRHFKGKRVDAIRSRVGFPKAAVIDSAPDNNLRARSFLFFALAVAAADASSSTIIYVPENGFISLNVPLDPLRLGSLSTRTTHPFYMARMNELLTALGFKAQLMNPYRHMTKGQMVQRSADLAFIAKNARHTMSCSAPTKHRFNKDENLRKPGHCGHCVPCLIRRAALVSGLGQDDTYYTIANLHARTLDSGKAEGEHIRSFQYQLEKYRNNPSRSRFDIHRPGPLTDHLGELDAYEAVYVEGLLEVGNILDGVKAKPLDR